MNGEFSVGAQAPNVNEDPNVNLIDLGLYKL